METKEEKERMEQEEENIKQRKELVNKKLKEVIIFPGNKSEYEEFRGYRVEIIDTERLNKGVKIGGDMSHLYSMLGIDCLRTLEHILNEGAEAIINVSNPAFIYQNYGLPVRKARNSNSTFHYLDF